MNAVFRFLARHPVLSTIGGFLLALALLGGALTLHARGYYGASVLSDLPQNDAKLRAAALPTVAPGPEGSGRPPTFLILGSSHLDRDDDSVRATEQQRVTNALSAFAPDMLVVEELPPDWPVGKGRDYRPGFDLEKYADQWNLSIAEAPAVIDSLGTRGDLTPTQHCRLGRAYFLARALANAVYQWTATRCPATEGDDRLARGYESELEEEMVQIGFPVARAHGVKQVVPFDYQGDDAEWFLYDELTTLAKQWQLVDLVGFWPAVQARYTLRAYEEAHSDSLSAHLHYLNSPEWLAANYWAYEQTLVEIDYRDAGPRQVDNYWLRNRRMFAEVEEAIEKQQPDRVMIVVGAGHNYFLDTLVRDAGYRWVDPRDYLPAP